MAAPKPNVRALSDPVYIVTDIEADGPTPGKNSMLSFASVAVTGAGTTTVVLLDGRGRRLASWRVALTAGLNHPRLVLPAAVRKALIRRPGTYWLAWAAQATVRGDRSSDRKRVLMVSR